MEDRISSVNEQGEYEPYILSLTDEDGNALSEEDWVNAFDSFRLDVICAACGKSTDSVIDIETA